MGRTPPYFLRTQQSKIISTKAKEVQKYMGRQSKMRLLGIKMVDDEIDYNGAGDGNRILQLFLLHS